MTLTEGTRLARVERVVAAGRRAADDADPLGREAREALLASSGLSAEGVALALGAHLETHPAPEHLAALLASAGRAPGCHVVLAANVCTAALRALAVAVATAPRVSVRPSRRDPSLARMPGPRPRRGPGVRGTREEAVACVEAIAAPPGGSSSTSTDPTRRCKRSRPRPRRG